MRGADFVLSPTLEQVLTLPTQELPTPAPPELVSKAWSAAIGDVPVMLVRNVDRARALFLEAASATGVSLERIGLPANASRTLTEAVKQHGARPQFLNLTADLAIAQDWWTRESVQLLWAQPAGGLGQIIALSDVMLWIDHADTLPVPVSPGVDEMTLPHAATTTLWGLHLSADRSQAGALLAFAQGDDATAGELFEAVAALLQEEDHPDWSRAYGQLQRLQGSANSPGLAQRQSRILQTVRYGLQEAAGLHVLPLFPTRGLPHGVAVQIPEEIDAATFYAYITGENTPVRWMPLVRPLHYAAARQKGHLSCTETEQNLARWLIIPVGPGYTPEEIDHAVLGMVKASEYLGVRWRVKPERAATYASWINERYGPDHDGYRPLFAVAANGRSSRQVQDMSQNGLATQRHLRDAHTTAMSKRQRYYHRGDFIMLNEDAVLQVQEGVLALTVIHPDGAEVLLGLYGPGQILIGHPDDSCFIQLIAHTDVVVTVESWQEALAQPHFAGRVCMRLRQMEAWAAMQARPYLDQRVLGILSLLAEQFGTPHPQGLLIDVRITHAQLASAVGATRATVTRILGELRRRGILTSVGRGEKERFCLRQWESSDHGFHHFQSRSNY